MAKSLTLGKMTWVDEKNYHDGAGKGRCSKAKIKTQLITAYEQSGKEWKKFEGGKYTKTGKNANFDFFFDKSGEIQVKAAGQSGRGTGTGIMWKDLDIMKRWVYDRSFLMKNHTEPFGMSSDSKFQRAQGRNHRVGRR